MFSSNDLFPLVIVNCSNTNTPSVFKCINCIKLYLVVAYKEGYSELCYLVFYDFILIFNNWTFYYCIILKLFLKCV